MVEVDNKYEVLNNHLGNLLNTDLYKAKVINSCPHCKSTLFIKHGSYQNKQRFLCKSCRKTFTKITNTPLYRSKKSTVLWAKFINLMLSKKTLRKSSKELNISLPTAFYWRHKLLNSLRKFKEPTVLTDLIDMIKIFTKENYKGDRNAPLTERKKVWTIVAHDINESVWASPISIGKWDRKSFDKIIYSKIEDEAYLNTFLDSYLLEIAKRHNEKSKTNKGDKRIIYNTDLWNYIREIRDLLRRFKGVATKYLTHYFSLSGIFSVTEKYDSTSLIYELSNIDTYIINKDLKLIKILTS